MTQAARAARTVLDGAGVPFAAVDTVFELDMLYTGQTHSVSVPLPVDAGRVPAPGCRRRSSAMPFEDRYRAVYGRLAAGHPDPHRQPAHRRHRPPSAGRSLRPQAVRPMRPSMRPDGTPARIWVDGGWAEAAVYDRLALPVDTVIAGLAILEQPDTTILIDPGLVGRVDGLGNLIIERRSE